MKAADIIALLDLQPHPEGGHFRETFRDSAVAGSGRAASTAIYFLLRDGEVSRWHRVDAAEVWHWYAGAPLLITVVDAAGRRETRLGADLAGGERPQAVVPPHAWQHRPGASGHGRWSAARWLPASSSPASSWRPPAAIQVASRRKRSSPRRGRPTPIDGLRRPPCQVSGTVGAGLRPGWRCSVLRSSMMVRASCKPGTS